MKGIIQMKCLAENEMTMQSNVEVMRLGMRGIKLSHENHQSSSSTCSSTWWVHDVTRVKESIEWGFRPFREKVRTSSENGNLDREIHKQGVLKTRMMANDKGGNESTVLLRHMWRNKSLKES